MAEHHSERAAQGHLLTWELVGMPPAAVPALHPLQRCLQSFDCSGSAHEPFCSCLQEVLLKGTVAKGCTAPGM